MRAMAPQAQRSVLIVDDETLFTQSLAEGLLALEWGLTVTTAANGLEAVAILEKGLVDLVVTDLKMPEMDGFELLAWMSREAPTVPVIVMTAFGTPEIEERLRSFGLEGFVEKPVDFGALSERISAGLDEAARGFVSGIPLSTFLQILEIEKKTCTLRIRSGARTGLLHVVGGAPWDAEAGEKRGEEAAGEIVTWAGVAIEILPAAKARERRVKSTLGAAPPRGVPGPGRGARGPGRRERPFGFGVPGEGARKKPDRAEGGIQHVRCRQTQGAIVRGGFRRSGVFTPTGESLAIFAPGTGFSKEIGILANNVLMNAQKASLEMGAGRGQQVHIEGRRPTSSRAASTRGPTRSSRSQGRRTSTASSPSRTTRASVSPRCG